MSYLASCMAPPAWFHLHARLSVAWTTEPPLFRMILAYCGVGFNPYMQATDVLKQTHAPSNAPSKPMEGHACMGWVQKTDDTYAVHIHHVWLQGNWDSLMHSSAVDVVQQYHFDACSWHLSIVVPTLFASSCTNPLHVLAPP